MHEKPSSPSFFHEKLIKNGLISLHDGQRFTVLWVSDIHHNLVQREQAHLAVDDKAACLEICIGFGIVPNISASLIVV